MTLPSKDGSYDCLSEGCGTETEDDALPTTPSHVHSTLNLTGAAINDTPESERTGAPSIALPNQDAEYVSHIALDIGGSLIKLVYFSPDPDSGTVGAAPTSGAPNNGSSRGGRLHFVKFETNRIDDALDFIKAKGLHRHMGRKEMHVKATGGGAYKFADEFKEKLGVVLEREDEMSCAVAGCNFLLKAIHHEAFTFENGAASFVPTNESSDLFPYLLVNIGSGVSMLKVSGDGQYERVSGTNLGGGTFWGLGRLLTRVRDFDEMLALSARGDNSNVDMLVGDIYGGRDYTNIGLSASTIASSFGKVVSQDKELEDYDPADMAMALCRMIAYNIGQLAYLNAMRFNLKRVFFGGFFIRGHPYTMETISFAIRFWSKGEMAAMFLRHEGFLGAVGAFLKVHPMPSTQSNAREPRKVRSRFVERFSMGAPLTGGEVVGPPICNIHEKVSWVEKFVQVGAAATQAAKSEHDSLCNTVGAGTIGRQPSASDELVPQRMSLHVGVLQYSPSLESLPLLEDPMHYEPNTFDINEDPEEYSWWLRVLEEQIPTVVEKAIASEGDSEEVRRRAVAFGRAFAAHLAKLSLAPGAYGALGLAELFELREDCLREFGFMDVYRHDKLRENKAAMAVLPDLLKELDAMPHQERLLALVQGVLAANIFDWGAKACVDLYHNGTILDIYREARSKLSCRPWRVDQFDVLSAAVLRTTAEDGTTRKPPYRRVMMFVDNAGADLVLGMLPFARELLRLGCEVVLSANSQPAINDIVAGELVALLDEAIQFCPIMHAAWHNGLLVKQAHGNRVPPYPGLHRQASSSDLTAPRSPETGTYAPRRYSRTLSAGNRSGTAQETAEGRASRHHAGSTSSTGSLDRPLRKPQAASAAGCTAEAGGTAAPANVTTGPLAATDTSCASCGALRNAEGGFGSTGGGAGKGPEAVATAAGGARAEEAEGAAAAGGVDGVRVGRSVSASTSGRPSTDGSAMWPHEVGQRSSSDDEVMQGGQAAYDRSTPKLFVVANGQGGPCLDLRRVPDELADASLGVDLLVIEGMGRAIHTNFRTRFRCDVLKLAMIKTARLAKKMFNGQLYDCVCLYQPAHTSPPDVGPGFTPAATLTQNPDASPPDVGPGFTPAAPPAATLLRTQTPAHRTLAPASPQLPP